MLNVSYPIRRLQLQNQTTVNSKTQTHCSCSRKYFFATLGETLATLSAPPFSSLSGQAHPQQHFWISATDDSSRSAVVDVAHLITRSTYLSSHSGRIQKQSYRSNLAFIMLTRAFIMKIIWKSWRIIFQWIFYRWPWLSPSSIVFWWWFDCICPSWFFNLHTNLIF